MSEKHLKNEITNFLGSLGAFKIGVADPHAGFAHALKGCHPLDVMENCRSIVVYAFNIGLDFYTALDYESNNIRIGHLYRDWTGLQLITFLRKKGYDATEVPREHLDQKNKIASMSFKLAAYEAGLGVFGRPSIIITPEYGPRVNIGVVLTNAALESDKLMENFRPCEQCSVCVKICPVNAIKADLPAPTGFQRKKCVSFVDWVKEETNGKIKLCGCCYDRCPAGKLIRKTLEVKKWATLGGLTAEDREELVSRFAN